MPVGAPASHEAKAFRHKRNPERHPGARENDSEKHDRDGGVERGRKPSSDALFDEVAGGGQTEKGDRHRNVETVECATQYRDRAQREHEHEQIDRSDPAVVVMPQKAPRCHPCNPLIA